MAISITISSAGTSDTLVLDYIGAKTTTLGAYFSSSTSSAAFNFQITLDSSAQGVTPTWFFASTTTFTSSTHFDLPTVVQVLTPIAGARLNSTGLSSGSITLKALQNAGG